MSDVSRRLQRVWRGTRRAVRHPRWFWREHRRLALAAGAAALVLLVGGGVLAYELLKRPADVHNSNVAFKPQKPPKPQAKTVNWPMFGLNPARTRYLPVKGVKPPYKLIWHYTERPLLEFPPIYAGGKLYAVNNSGTAFSLDADTGRVLWERRIGRLNASSPAYYKHRLYIVNLVPGHVVKLDARTGKVLWKHALPGRAESSPLVLDGTVYFGCENDQLFALSTRNGHVRWATTLGGPIKSAPAYRKGVLYVGDYGGYMNAVDAKSGAIEWQSGSLGQGFGTSGEFYSTPALAYGRVYAGNNDTRVYSFDQKDGTLAWSYSTGGYVYSGPVVANTRHTGPTVYIGSFDGNIYALNAKSGEPRWIRSAGGSVIGSLSAVGDIVYAAEFSNGSTEGFAMKTGRRVFHYKTGTYTPVISDGRRIYLVGYSSINALQPYKWKAGLADNRKAKPARHLRRPGNQH
ncbi:MAG TPA: PQQ-binding-like beta-propeller repeat protein [Solirubrobacterales bacterium]|nr:PQQ-binding-like beta-propeller repeat protein [Solirubrobacterales bacterium]